MGKTALFAIAAFTIMTGYYGASSQEQLLNTTENVTEHQYTIMAKNAAITGHNLAKERLVKQVEVNNTFSSETLPPGMFEGATYTAGISVSSGIASVTSRGQAFLPDGDMVDYTVYAKYKIVGTTSGEIPDEAPEFLQYAILADGDLDFGGSLLVDTLKVEGTEDTQYNANVHTNGTLKASGNKAKIRGFGTYRLNENVKHDNFAPVNNAAKDNAVKQVAKDVALADLNTADIAVKAQALTTPANYQEIIPSGGTHDLTGGTITGGTREEPLVYHVKGDLSISGSTTIDGYVMFVVDGDVKITGNVQQGTKDKHAESHIAFYNGGTFDLTGTPDLFSGQVYAKGEVKLGGTAEIRGNLVSENTVSVSGTPKVKYYPASPALSAVFNTPEQRIKLIAYSER